GPLRGDGDRGGGDVALARFHGQPGGDRVEADVHDRQVQTEVRGDGPHQLDVEAGVLPGVVRILVLHRRVRGVGADREDTRRYRLEVGCRFAVAGGRVRRVRLGRVGRLRAVSVAATTGRQGQGEYGEEGDQPIGFHSMFLPG